MASEDEEEMMPETPGSSKRSADDSESPQSVLPSSKRRRTGVVPRGQVVKVRVHNFMTYADATIVPGPRLNLVLGPNGTGKSSFVNAVMLGLGGVPKLIGRAEKMHDFVRKGFNEGWTEVHLSNGTGGTIVIRRLMNGTDNSSKWTVNGRERTQRDVLKIVSDMKIQVDNLCQFLPQDKVVMFARLTPVELLRETEKAIGCGELHDMHEELCLKKEAQNNTAQETAVLEAELTKLKAANAGQERDVARFKEREAILAKVDILQKKLPWQRYKATKETFTQTRDMRNRATERLKAKEEELAAQQGPLRERQRQLGEARTAKEAAKRAAKKAEDVVFKAHELASNLSEQLEQEQDAIDRLEVEGQEHDKRIQQAEAKVAEVQDQLDALVPPPRCDEARKKELQREATDRRTQVRAAEQEYREIEDRGRTCEQDHRRLNQKLRVLDSVKQQRLKKLEQRNPGITHAAQWVEENQTRFRGRVLGPIICEVNVPNQLHAQMLEQHVPNTNWLNFVTETREDQDQLIRISREQNWRHKPSVVFSRQGNAAGALPHPKGDASQFARYGIEATLDEVFEAPPLVKHNLADECGVNEAYIGSGDAARHIEALYKDGVRLVWTPDSQHRTSTSTYNQAAKTQMVIPLRPAQYLTASSGGAERENLVRDLRSAEEELALLNHQLVEQEAAMAAAKQAVEAIRKQETELTQAKVVYDKKLRELTNRKQMNQRGLKRLQDAPEPRSKAPELQAAQDRTPDKAVAAAKKAAKALQDLWAAMKAEAPVTLAHTQLEGLVATLKQLTRGHEEEVATFKRRLDELERVFETERETLKRHKEQAEEATGEWTAELAAEFETVAEHGDSVEDLNTSINTLQGQADGISCSNPRVMEQYLERVRKISELEAQHESAGELLETRKAELANLEGQWRPQLEEIVGKVNITFARAFAKIGCAGEVDLHIDEDYHACAINIKVKFREAEDLQVLNAHRQSGGERSVSTILYLVALQDVAACPFRVVDEINQGMDPYNERKVFMELVNAATEEGTPQCFLLTPKLLADLPFSQDVMVLQIMNGPAIDNAAFAHFDQAAAIGSRQMIAAH